MALAGAHSSAPNAIVKAAVKILLNNNRRPHRCTVMEVAAVEIRSGLIGGDRLRRSVGLEGATGEPARERRSALLRRLLSERRAARERRRVRNQRRGMAAEVIDI